MSKSFIGRITFTFLILSLLALLQDNVVDAKANQQFPKEVDEQSPIFEKMVSDWLSSKDADLGVLAGVNSTSFDFNNMVKVPIVVEPADDKQDDDRFLHHHHHHPHQGYQQPGNQHHEAYYHHDPQNHYNPHNQHNNQGQYDPHNQHNNQGQYDPHNQHNNQGQYDPHNQHNNQGHYAPNEQYDPHGHYKPHDQHNTQGHYNPHEQYNHDGHYEQHHPEVYEDVSEEILTTKKPFTTTTRRPIVATTKKYIIKPKPQQEPNVKVLENYHNFYPNGREEFSLVLSNGMRNYRRIYNKLVDGHTYVVQEGYYTTPFYKYPHTEYQTVYYTADEKGYRVYKIEVSETNPATGKH